jgi:hypothetical protein
MVQQKSDNQPTSKTKLLKFTGRDRQSNSELSVCPEPADMMRLAVELALFDAGSMAAQARAAEISSINTLALATKKSPLSVRRASAPDVEAIVSNLSQAPNQSQAISADAQKKQKR